MEADILLEPARRDSGPAILPGPLRVRRGGDCLVVALAADHVVTDPGAFAKMCRLAGEAAREDKIVMFGVEPNRPATEYGYIRPAQSIRPGLFAIERFVEKPDAETAARYVADGYLWNSGNFVFRAGFLLEEYRRFEPDSGDAVMAAVEGAGSDLGFVTLELKAFARAAAKSIDYALMERTGTLRSCRFLLAGPTSDPWQAVWNCRAR